MGSKHCPFLYQVKAKRLQKQKQTMIHKRLGFDGDLEQRLPKEDDVIRDRSKMTMPGSRPRRSSRIQPILVMVLCAFSVTVLIWVSMWSSFFHDRYSGTTNDGGTADGRAKFGTAEFWRKGKEEQYQRRGRDRDRDHVAMENSVSYSHDGAELDISKWSARGDFDVQSFVQYLSKPVYPYDGRAGKDAIEFRKDFLSLEMSKNRVQISRSTKFSNTGSCDFHGPKFVARGSIGEEDATVEALLKQIDSGDGRIEKHLRETGAELLSLDDHTLCTWDPHVFLPSLPKFSATIDDLEDDDNSHGTRQRDLVASSYLFHDVCITFNIDSSKQAQRGVIMIDPTSTHKLRCVFCPNPQTTFEWSSNRCGMMWFHQANAASLADYRDCYHRNERDMRKYGQRQVPGEKEFKGEKTSPRAAIYYKDTTLLLQYTRNNPGHQYWDTLSSIIPVLRSQERHGVRYFDRVAVHQTPLCEDNIWICSLLRKLGAISPPTEKSEHGNLVEMFPGVLTCFEHLIVPIQGWNHNNEHSNPSLLHWTHDKLIEGYGLGPAHIKNEEEFTRMLQVISGEATPREGEEYKLLLYAHNTEGEAGQRRAWLDIQNTLNELAREATYLDVQYVPDFAKIGIQEQVTAFFDADMILMPHGGQFGNHIFIRPHTLVVELTCNGYSHLAKGEVIAESRGYLHIIEKPCACEKAHEASNFEYNLGNIRKVARTALKMEPTGTMNIGCQ